MLNLKKRLSVVFAAWALLWAFSASGAVGVGYSVWTGSNAVTSVTSTSGTTTNNSTFVLFVSYRNSSMGAAAPTSVVDSKSNTYTLAQSVLGVASFYETFIYYCISCTGGAGHTATVTWANACDLCSVAFIEFTGVGAGTFDSAPTGNASGGTQVTTINGPSITTTVANELVVNGYANYSGATQTITDTGSGYSIIVSQPTGFISKANGAVSWAAPASTGASADTFNWTATDYAAALSLSIKPAGGAPVTHGVVISNRHPVKSGSYVLYQ